MRFAFIGQHRVERLMRQSALKARPRRRGKSKDDGDRSVIAGNILDRDFRAERPNQKWLADFTYICTAEGWLYVAAVVDLFSRRVVGWSMKAERDASPVMEALMMAIWRRGKADALLHHLDQGSQSGHQATCATEPIGAASIKAIRKRDAATTTTRTMAQAEPPPMLRAGILLAAGQSRRFGTADKLLAGWRGRPLVAHAAMAMRQAPLDLRIAVASNPAVIAELDGFVIVPPGNAASSQSASLRAGVARARDLGADCALVALADMPRVTPDLIAAVLDRCTPTRPAAATDGRRPMPPACFPAAWFDRLLQLDGDRGAGALLAGLPPDALAMAVPLLLHDVDTPDDLSR